MSTSEPTNDGHDSGPPPTASTSKPVRALSRRRGDLLRVRSAIQTGRAKPEVDVEGSRNVTLALPPIGMINDDKHADQRMYRAYRWSGLVGRVGLEPTTQGL